MSEFVRMEGAASRPFDLGELEKDLRAMWRSTSATAGSPGPDGRRHGMVYRAAMSNLVVPLDPERHARMAPILVEITRRHPSRLLLVEIGKSGSRVLLSEVAALCHVRPSGGYVCSEQIILRGDAEAGPLVPSAVSALLVGNLPTVLLDLHGREPRPWIQELADRADLVLCDTRESPSLDDAGSVWRAIEADPDNRVRDLAWSRLTPWREILADGFDSTHLGPACRSLREVTLEHGSPETDGVPSCLLLLAGWLASRLGWRVRSTEPNGATFDAPQGLVRLRFARDPEGTAGSLYRVELRSGPPHPLDLRVTHRPAHREATFEVSAPERQEVEIPFHYRNLAECLVTEIHRHEPNPQLTSAVRCALALLPTVEHRAA
ncbi:MAG TPA: glucose-6-phosphate dehydrogenase assembly protein OpcA [Candidatus Eisenbacteria bacterium]|jgi:glucose-6-phosphate dehydrogenase assembly protein OpcA|nr:glucose-6-phosphate dehydrogenase assembly protein OpcA [Candidatus Eisenbacteria bacterium]